MTFFVKCNTCGKTQEADEFDKTFPCNPVNPETNEKWYSRTKDGKTLHACCEEHIPQGEMLWPKWAKP